jgi:DNA-binding NtrC family response regulator
MTRYVLFVDDDTNLLEGLERQLHPEPYTILTASSGEAALEILSKHPVEVVVTDQTMPGLNGTQFLWQVRRAHPHMEFIILSGNVSERTAQLAVTEIGVAAILDKPCQGHVLAPVIRQLLRYRDAMQAVAYLSETAVAQRALLNQVVREGAINRSVVEDIESRPAPEALESVLRRVADTRSTAAHEEGLLPPG